MTTRYLIAARHWGIELRFTEQSGRVVFLVLVMGRGLMEISHGIFPDLFSGSGSSLDYGATVWRMDAEKGQLNACARFDSDRQRPKKVTAYV